MTDVWTQNGTLPGAYWVHDKVLEKGVFEESRNSI